MKLLLNENIGGSVAAFLRDAGHDVLWVGESFPGVSDKLVIATAFREDRVLVTKDKDFGEFVFKSGMPHRGVILLRLSDDGAESTIRTIAAVLKVAASRPRPFFIVASETGMRIRPAR